MKQFIAFTLLLSFFAVQANEDEKDKRPSWSQGLPEKKDAPEFNKPDFEMETMEIERPTFETNLIKPKIGYTEEIESVETQSAVSDKQIESPADFESQAEQTVLSDSVSEPESQEQFESDSAPAVDEKPVENEVVDSVSQQLPTQTEPSITDSVSNETTQYYSWEITRQLPIEVSSRLYEKQSSVLLKIFINAKGDVIAVEPVLNDTPESLINLAERSIKRWKFVSPQSLGFKQQVLSRVFKVTLSEKG